MQLEVGKEYVTRDGHKAVCTEASGSNCHYPFRVDVEGVSPGIMYVGDGNYWAESQRSPGAKHDLDIVGEWPRVSSLPQELVINGMVYACKGPAVK